MANNLYAFLHPIKVIEEKEVIVSDRFRNENGSVEPFKIKALTQAENDEITKKSRKVVKTNGVTQEVFDPVEYNRRLIVTATIHPDFKSKEICDCYGVVDPLLVPGIMLKPGEYTALVEAISGLMGYRNESDEEQLKN